MKLSEFNKYLEKNDPGTLTLGKSLAKTTPPRRKVNLFLDRNIPRELIKIVQVSKDFKITGIAKENDSDEFIWQIAKHQNAIILSLDKGDFWNDKKFPLHDAPGVILIASREQSVNVYVEALNLFLFGMDMVGGIRKIPGFFYQSKSKISTNGFSHKFISHEGGVEVINIEYD
jgi:predicted nuclease of predicted toxin-antitoxin system